MQPVRFIHAADLHLDAVFPGLARDVSPELARGLHEATFTALRRLVDLCEKESPDFLILAGDTWNQEDLSLRAQFALRDACESLGKRGIRVFMVHGNHDPLSSRLKALRWPANVTVFGPGVEAVPVCRPGYGDEVVAIIHGVSHVGPKETRNLAAWFHRTEHACPQIGVLHTTFNVGSSGETPYAPCSPDDLAASGLDYWALGHIHAHSVVGQNPMAVYPGSVQGLNINEQGPHGCVLVTLTPAGEGDAEMCGVAAAVEFRPLAPVAWHILEVNLEDAAGEAQESVSILVMDSDEPDDNAPDRLPLDGHSSGRHTLDMSGLERLIRERIELATSSLWPGCETLALRVRLTGRTPLDAELRRLSVRRELCDLLGEGHDGAAAEIWIKDMEVETRPVLDRDSAVKREDLLGEVLRQSDEWRADENLLAGRAGEALSDLFARGRSGRVLDEPRGEELAALLEEAERLCADLLENN